MNKTAPSELDSIGLDGSKFHPSGRNQWSGPCPRCGGENRFVIFTDSEFPHWNFFCRNGSCDFSKGGWADELNPRLRKPIPSYKKRELEDKRRAQEQELQRERLARLEEYTTGELWTQLHKRMTDENRAWWRGAGVPDDWQNFWKLGYTPEKNFLYEDLTYTLPAYTIPKFDLGWKPTNIDYRLIGLTVEQQKKMGKYRPAAGLPPAAFLSRPDLDKMPDEVWVVEGSKKAMTVCLRQQVGDVPQMVIGLPSKNSWAGVVDRVKDCKRVWTVFDPDATDWADKFGVAVGEAARIVELTVKPDDAFLHYGMTPEEWKMQLWRARKPIRG